MAITTSHFVKHLPRANTFQSAGGMRGRQMELHNILILGIGRDGSEAVPPFQGLWVDWMPFPGRCPGLICGAPAGA